MLNALKETEQALSTYAGELDRHTALQTARDQAMSAFNLAQRQLPGRRDQLPRPAERRTTLVGADQALAASDQALASDQVAVFQALGGGWQGAPKPAVKDDGKPQSLFAFRRAKTHMVTVHSW